MNTQSRWFAVRIVFRHSVTSDKALFEEKINLYLADTAESAIQKASRDVAKYLELNKEFVPIKRFSVYELGHDKPNLDGEEIWSHMSNGPADLDDFYREKYEKFEDL